MKTKFKLLIAILALFFTMSCSETKEDYIKDFREFVEKTTQKGKDYSEEQWKKMDAQYKEFSEKKYQQYSSELTAGELVEITKLKATYITSRGVNSIKNAFETPLNQKK